MSVTATGAGQTRFGLLILLFGGGVTDRLPPVWDGIMAGFLVVVRLFLALPFFKSALVRINSWGSQGFLFEHEHPLPLLSPTLAAWITTAAEIVLPILLVAGLFGRVAGLGLAIMAAVILFVVGGAYALPPEQVPWIAAGLLIAITGPGRLSLDDAVVAGLDKRGRVPVLESLIALGLVAVLFEKTDAWTRLLGFAEGTTTPLAWFF